jgi:hypothetical protein
VAAPLAGLFCVPIILFIGWRLAQPVRSAWACWAAATKKRDRVAIRGRLKMARAGDGLGALLLLLCHTKTSRRR